MPNLYSILPNLEPDEMHFVQSLVKDMNETQLQQFATIYSTRRKDPQTILLLTLIGFLGISGVQRFVLDQIGMGLLYLFTGGLCLVGTIVDLVNYKNLALEYNQKVSLQVSGIVKG